MPWELRIPKSRQAPIERSRPATLVFERRPIRAQSETGRVMDRESVQLAQRGDQEAFGVLARTTADWLFAVAHRMLRDFGQAEDAVQQTLEIAWRELPTLRDPDRFEAWLRRLLVRVCYVESRRARRWDANVRALSVDEPARSDHQISLADRDQLERGFRRLPPDQRAILVLHHYLGLDSVEIADALGIPAGTARSRLHYAHRAMRAALEADERRGAIGGHRA
jgi:RNA polymerase sigma-70 factor, ECF subfamily